MIRGQQLTAIIPVRGGSKGIPGKNLYRLGKDTLLERTIKLAKKCPYIDLVLVTTDDAEMYAIAKAHGVATTVLRPQHLATDGAKTVDVVIDMMQSEVIDSGYLVLLQVTTPLRTLAALNAFCAQFESSELSVPAIVSLTEHGSPHPDKLQKIEDGQVVSYAGKDSHVARQQLPKVYQLNGAFYLTHRDVVLTQKTFLPKGTIPFWMPVECSINLDGPNDLLLLECLLEKGRIEIEEYD